MSKQCDRRGLTHQRPAAALKLAVRITIAEHEGEHRLQEVHLLLALQRRRRARF
jgi:hypothetical protein